MRGISTAVLISVGVGFWGVGASAQDVKIGERTDSLTALGAQTNIAAQPQLSASSDASSSTSTSGQLSASAGRLDAGVVVQNRATLGTGTVPRGAAEPSAAFATSNDAASASVSIVGANIAAVESPTTSSVTGALTSSEANGRLHDFTSATTAPVLGR